MPEIQLAGITKRYTATGPVAVEDLSMTIPDGEFMCLLGPSGCGKTTTLRMISGLEHPSEGSITMGEAVVDDVLSGTFVPPEKRNLGLVFQSYALWPHLTVRQNVEFGLKIKKLNKDLLNDRVDHTMRKLGIEDYQERYPAELSGGQQQRVALARMLAMNPQVLLLDEPLSNLDARLRLEMRAELTRIHKEFNTTIVFVTHDQWEAMTLASSIAVMNNGQLQQIDTPDNIYRKPANRFVAEFVGSPPINIFDLKDKYDTGLSSKLDTFVAEKYSGARMPVDCLGVRPETIRVTNKLSDIPPDALSIPCTIFDVLPTGGSWIIELDSFGNRSFAVSMEQPELKINDSYQLWTPSQYVLAFDVDGNRLDSD